MLTSLTEQLRDKALDLVGFRLLHFSASSRLAYESRFGKSLSGLPSPLLVLCVYGYNAIDQLHDILGTESPDLAKRTDPESVRALFGETKERNCVYTAKLKQRVYKEMCVWFGGRTDRTPVATIVDCPVMETVAVAIGAEVSCERLFSIVEKALKLGFVLSDLVRLTEEATVQLGFPTVTRTVLKTKMTARNAWLITMQKPGAVRHLPCLFSLCGLSEATARVVSPEEAASFSAATNHYGNLELFSGVSYLLLTPEAFIQTASAFPAIRIAEKVAEMSEVLSIRVGTSEFPNEVESDYIDTIQQTAVRPQLSNPDGKLLPWLAVGPTIAIAYLAETSEAGKALLASIRKEVANCVFSLFTKPSYLLIPRSGPQLIPPSSLLFDPFSRSPALVSLPPLGESDESLSTVCVIKPEKGQTMLRQVLKFARRHGFQLCRAHMQRLTEGLADLLFEHQREGMDDDTLQYDSFKSNLLCGPVITLRLSRQNAIKRLKEAVGHPNPQKADLNSLRGSFGKSPEDNKLHCSLSFSHAQTEELRLFSGEEFLRSSDSSWEVEGAICVIALRDIDEQESLTVLLEEVKGMQLTLVDLRLSVVPEKCIEAYQAMAPDDAVFAEELRGGKCLTLALVGLSPVYRMQTLFRTLKIDSHVRCPSLPDSIVELSELFLPPFPY